MSEVALPSSPAPGGAGQGFRHAIKSLCRALGLKVQRFHPRYDETIRLVRLLQENGIDLVFDVGASTGQFGIDLRREGYRGRIISFEPLSRSHQRLTHLASADPDWQIAPRCAVGATPGTTRVNIAGNSDSSSILGMLDRHRDGLPGVDYVASEEASVTTLDAFIDGSGQGCRNAALKLDTQGFEMEVLKGAERHMTSLKMIYTELSLQPVYDGAPGFLEMYQYLTQRGFTCVSLMPTFVDTVNYEVLQVNGAFLRK